LTVATAHSTANTSAAQYACADRNVGGLERLGQGEQHHRRRDDDL